MAIQIIDTFKQKNDGEFAIVEANDLLGGFYQVDSIAERNSIPSCRKIDGMLCYVKSDPKGINLYQWFGNQWIPPNFPARDKVFSTVTDRDAYPLEFLHV